MAERKLNINAPLLSVRRFSMISSSSNGEDEKVLRNSMPNRRHTVSSFRSDSTLDQVTEPVAVPFLWEQIPGRRKDGNEPAPEPVEEASITPRLPPGRVDVVRKPFGKECNDEYEVRPNFKALPSTDNLTKLDSFKEGMNKKEDSDSEGEDDNDDDAYSDALDTLSSTESFSMNCSVSSLSGSDGLDAKQSGNFSTDPQTRDFMMSRFLPAAKAMALQPVQYASKKQQPVLPQEPRPDKMIVAVRRPSSPNKYGSITIPHYSQDKEEEEEEESDDEDKDEKHYDSGNISAKGCGLFPRLCLKSSLCLLNPVPGLKVRTQAPISSTSEVERPGKTASVQTYSQTIKKDTVYKHKSAELQKVNQNVTTGGSKRFSYSGNLQTMGRLSPSRRSGGISSYRREAPQSPFRGVGFLGIPKDVQNFKSNQLNSNKKGSFVDQRVMSYQRTKQGSGSVIPTVEKTLYVDTVNTAEILHSNSSFSDTKGQVNSADEDSETILESTGLEAIATMESSFQDIKCLNIVKGGTIKDPKVSDISLLKGEAGMLGDFRMDERLGQETKLLECTKLNHGQNLNISNHQTPVVDDSGIVNVGLVESPLPPPLPKSPSESWLWRTLPSVPLQNAHSYFGTQFHPRKQDVKTPTNTKWETIVKTSNPHHDHARYSQELITHVSQQYKS